MAPLAQELAVCIERLNTVAVVGDVHSVLAVDHDVHGCGELAIALARGAPFQQELPVGVELLYAGVQQIGDIEIALTIDRPECRTGKLAIASSPTQVPRQKLAVPIEFHDPIELAHIDIVLSIDVNRANRTV